MRRLLVTLLFTFNLTLALSQGLTNQGNSITILENTVVWTNGSITNDGEIINGGQITTHGDWINYKKYTPLSGEIILSGDLPQKVRHNQGSISTLTIAGSGEKSIQDNLTVLNQLNLESAIVTPESSSKLVLSNGASIHGGSDISFINGALYHSGNGPKFYPIGKNGNYTPVELKDVKGNNPVVGIEMFEEPSTPWTGSEITKVSQKRYWMQSVAGGTYEGSIVTLKVLDDESLSDVELKDLVVAQSTIKNGRYANLMQSTFDSEDGKITSSLPATSPIVTLGVYFKEKEVWIPNVLSPKATNSEDQVVKIYGRFISSRDFMFRVYNRWGELIYENDSFEKFSSTGWNGVNQKTGVIEGVGVYKYTLKATYNDGQKINQVGSIMILE